MLLLASAFEFRLDWTETVFIPNGYGKEELGTAPGGDMAVSIWAARITELRRRILVDSRCGQAASPTTRRPETISER